MMSVNQWSKLAYAPCLILEIPKAFLYSESLFFWDSVTFEGLNCVLGLDGREF